MELFINEVSLVLVLAHYLHTIDQILPEPLGIQEFAVKLLMAALRRQRPIRQSSNHSGRRFTYF